MIRITWINTFIVKVIHCDTLKTYYKCYIFDNNSPDTAECLAYIVPCKA